MRSAGVSKVVHANDGDAMRGRRLFALAFVIALVPHAPLAALECVAPAQPMARVELLFGAGLAAGGLVTDAQWQQFVNEEVTPRFPDGLSEFTGQGQWRRPDGAIIREPSRMLLIWYDPTSARDADIEAIRAAYKVRFKQLSVMRVDGADCVSF